MSKILRNDGLLKLAVGIPAYGDTLTAHHARMWAEFGAVVSGSTQRFGLVMFSTVDINPIDRARNTLLAQAMLKDADWLFTIDADTWVEAEGDEDAGTMILRMISDAERREAWMVAAPVVRRSEHFLFDGREHMIYKAIDQNTVTQEVVKPRWKHEQINIELLPRALSPIDAAATACIALSCKRIAQNDDLFFRFNTAEQLSEDLDFCRQIRNSGGTIFVDPRVRTGHKSRSFALYSGSQSQTEH